GFFHHYHTRGIRDCLPTRCCPGLFQPLPCFRTTAGCIPGLSRRVRGSTLCRSRAICHSCCKKGFVCSCHREQSRCPLLVVGKRLSEQGRRQGRGNQRRR